MARRNTGACSSRGSPNWAYVDHLVLPPGASQGRHMHASVEEFYYVMNGEGVAVIGNEKASVRKGDAVPALLTDVHSFENTGSRDLAAYLRMRAGDCITLPGM